MKTKEFYQNLAAWLRTFKIAGKEVFKNNVFLVPVFPSMQLDNLISPSAIIIDQGCTPMDFHGQIFEQIFTIGIWYGKTADRMGTLALEGLQTIEASLFPALLALKTLNAEKIMIFASNKRPYQTTSNNYPATTHVRSYSVILEE